MKKEQTNFKKILFSVVGLASLAALSACTQPATDKTSNAPAGESPAATSSPVAQAPTTTSSPAAYESPAATSSPVAQAPTTTNSPAAYESPAATSSPVAGESPTATTSPAAKTTAATGESKNLVEVAASNDSFKTLAKAVKAAGLTDTLSAKGPYTVFAPTDEAFSALPKGTLDKLLKPENKQQLVKVLTYHVVPGEVTSSTIKPGDVNTVEGNPVTVKVDSASNTVKVNDAKVIKPDVKASNGVIHVVDKVILPPDVKASLDSKEKAQ